MSKRKLRSDTAAEQATATQIDLARAPVQVAQKQKESVAPKYLCTSCDTEKAARSFPNYNPTSECEHLINTCRPCLKQWVEVQVESSNFVRVVTGDGATFGIRCIECEKMMRPVNVEAAATKAIYEKFDRLAKRQLAESNPNWRWCLAPQCDNGQEHVKAQAAPETPQKIGKRKKKAPGAEKVEAPPVNIICTCTKCGAKACANCDVPWHEGETCEEYRQRAQAEQDEASTLLIKSTFKKCPSCSKSIEKNGGCDYMYCTQCHAAFCWRCVQVFEQGRYCACHPRPPYHAALNGPW